MPINKTFLANVFKRRPTENILQLPAMKIKWCSQPHTEANFTPLLTLSNKFGCVLYEMPWRKLLLQMWLYAVASFPRYDIDDWPSRTGGDRFQTIDERMREDSHTIVDSSARDEQITNLQARMWQTFSLRLFPSRHSVLLGNILAFKIGFLQWSINIQPQVYAAVYVFLCA